MAASSGEIKAAVKAYILDEFLPGENPDALTHDTPLITGGILDSIATVKLVDFLEGRFNVAFQAHEMSADYLDTIDEIADIVASKQ
jgi:acyl carrier protein